MVSTPGLLTKIGPTGHVFNNWCQVPDSSHLGFGGFTVDYEGVYNYSLIIASISGETYIIDSECRNITKLPARGSGSQFCEGAVVVPNNQTRWGSLAGNIYIGCESAEHYSYSPVTKTWKKWQTSITTDDLDLIPKNQNWFGMNWDAGKVRTHIITEK